jgi:hypothetical protein
LELHRGRHCVMRCGVSRALDNRRRAGG